MTARDQCVIATHIDSGWRCPDQYKDNLDTYLSDTSYDALVYVSSPHPPFSNDGYEDWADTVVASSNGHMPD